MSMEASRISALLEPFLNDGCPTSSAVRDVGTPDAGTRDGGFQPASDVLSPRQLEQISTYIDLLLRWNARINLTAIRAPEEIVTRHFGESLFLARHLFPNPNVAPDPDHSKLDARSSTLVAQSSKLVTDLGSGAGFPALPIKIWAPGIHLIMIESNQKKATFLREATRALTLTNVDVIAERAESVADRIQRPPNAGSPTPLPSATAFTPADVVTFRAVEKFTQILPIAEKLLTPSGLLALLVTEAQLHTLRTIQSMAWRTIHIPQSHSRNLTLGRPITI
ncbi:MAG: 16S rRNA (guanine(527)-N(7))-methyltransferase RsmG [Terriglobales bacterium]